MRTESEILNGLARYCSQAERCVDDVRKKIAAENLPQDAEKRIIDRLIREKFIDETRYCRSFTNDKLKFNHWGRIKIIYELKKRNIPPETYRDAIESIDENAYMSILEDLLKSKKRTTKGPSGQAVFHKLCNFAVSRGFEYPLIMKSLKEYFKYIDDDDSAE
jgi:regulatory protein